MKNLEVILETNQEGVVAYFGGFLTGVYFSGLLESREKLMDKGDVYRWKLSVRELFNTVNPKELERCFSKVLKLELGPGWNYKIKVTETKM